MVLPGFQMPGPVVYTVSPTLCLQVSLGATVMKMTSVPLLFPEWEGHLLLGDREEKKKKKIK